MSDRKYLIAEQSQFYRNNYRRLLTFAFVLTGIIFALVGYIVYEDMNMPEREYFATTSSGQVIKIFPLKPPS